MKNYKFLILLTLFGACLYFYNLNWGAPYYFHPDERNIASSVSQLRFPQQMNPNFFAYGSLPIYIIYFTGLNINYLTNFLNSNPQALSPNFEQAIIISRFYSAFFATLLIPLLFLIGKKLKNEQTGLVAALLTATSVGFIQFAHFGTFEMWLTFFSVLLFWLCLQQSTIKNMLLLTIVFGLLVAIKISSLVLFPILLVVLIKKYSVPFQKKISAIISRIIFFLADIVLILLIAGLVYFATNPFVVLDFNSFRGSMTYESTLAIGTLPVFYTGEFFNTIPVIFQFLHVYPFILNPLLTIIFIPAFCYLLFITIKHKKFSFMLLALFFMLLFLSQAVLFVKWVRYMIPTLPFIYLIVALAITNLLKKNHQQLNNVALTTIIVINSIFALSYFITAFVHADTRVAAKNFARKNIASNAPILSEVYDMGIVPFNNYYSAITLFNFYELDNNSPVINIETLTTQLAATDYIILPSQRLLKTRLLNKQKFPVANAFYQSLTTNNFLYQKIYATPCDIFCKITYLGDPIFSYEQTANVFDRPTIFIFEKK